MNRKALKKLKRRRKIARRLRCHGTKSACHHRRKVFKLNPRVGLWKKLKGWVIITLLRLFKKV